MLCRESIAAQQFLFALADLQLRALCAVRLPSAALRHRALQQSMHECGPPRFPQRANAKRELEDLLQVVVGRRVAIGRPFVGKRRQLRRQGRAQPAGVNGDDHHEQLESEQQMHSFEHLDHLRRRTAIEVVDVQDDAVDAAVVGLALDDGLVVRGDELLEVPEVFPDDREQAEVLAIVGTAGPLGEELAENPFRGEFLEPLLECFDPRRRIVLLGASGLEVHARPVELRLRKVDRRADRRLLVLVVGLDGRPHPFDLVELSTRPTRRVSQDRGGTWNCRGHSSKDAHQCRRTEALDHERNERYCRRAKRRETDVAKAPIGAEERTTTLDLVPCLGESIHEVVDVCIRLRSLLSEHPFDCLARRCVQTVFEHSLVLPFESLQLLVTLFLGALQLVLVLLDVVLTLSTRFLVRLDF